MKYLRTIRTYLAAFVAVFALMGAGSALAQCSGTLAVLDATSTSRSLAQQSVGGAEYPCAGPSGGWFTNTPTVTAAAYTSNQSIGGLQALTLGGTRLALFGISSKSGLTGPKGVCFFNANPTSSTFTDHGTFTVAIADLPKLMNPGCLQIAPVAFAGQTPTGNASNLDLPLPAGGAVWVAIYEGSTGETLASTSEFIETIGVE